MEENTLHQHILCQHYALGAILGVVLVAPCKKNRKGELEVLERWDNLHKEKHANFFLSLEERQLSRI